MSELLILDFNKKHINTYHNQADSYEPATLPKESKTTLKLPQFLLKKLHQQEEILFKSERTGNYLAIGKPADAKSIALQSNDYLSIAQHPDIVNAQIKALESQKKSSVMSAVFLGENSKQAEFESEMALFTGMPSAVLCQSGWAANVGLMQVIADKNIPVYIDMFTHMSLWEGVKQTGAPTHPFRHNNSQHLESLIKKHGPGVVLTESIFSTTGVVAPLKDIIAVANRYECISVVDESHSLGTHGTHGAGLVEELGLSNQVHFITASLAKAFAGRAGIILGPTEICKRTPFLAFPAIFSSALLQHEVEGLMATLKLIQNSDVRRIALHGNSEYLRHELDLLGYNIESQSQIIALEAGVVSNTALLRDVLDENNILGSAFYPPATPRSRSLVRFSVNSNLSLREMDTLLEVCKEIRSEVGMWDWKSVKRKQQTIQTLAIN